MNSLAKEYKQLEYPSHLYNKADGYIQIAHIGTSKVAIKSYKGITINQAIEKYIGLDDVFITPNTTYNGIRCVANIRQLRALYIDIDNRNWTFENIVYEAWCLAWEGKIPYPTMVVNSGRGCHLYWRIQDAPYQALATWQELEDFLYYSLKDIGADKQATDAARLLRLPGTINSKNNKQCEVIIVDNRKTYSMYDLRTEYLNKNITSNKVSNKTSNTSNKHKIIVNLFNSYTLHIARAEDILILCKLRDYKVNGYRNTILHCYAYWIGVTNRDSEMLEKEVLDLNNKFSEPLKENEVKAILRCVPKAINKFIEYEQGRRSGLVKRVSKNMRDKGGYWYKNSTLIEKLNITLEEQQSLKTIISSEEKYRRCAEDKKAKQKAKRRNSKGLTKREQQKQDTINKVLELKSKGLNNSQIASQLKITRKHVSNIVNSF